MMINNSEIARILQNMIDEAQENIEKVAEQEKTRDWKGKYIPSAQLLQRLHDIDEAMELVAALTRSEPSSGELKSADTEVLEICRIAEEQRARAEQVESDAAILRGSLNRVSTFLNVARKLLPGRPDEAELNVMNAQVEIASTYVALAQGENEEKK